MSDLARLESAIQAGISDGFRRSSRAIVAVGCGFCEECEALLELFPGSTLMLVDRDRGPLEAVGARLAARGDRVRTVLGDAVQLAQIAPGPYDFAIVRHPDISAQPAAWARVLGVACSQLRSTGLIMIVTFAAAEAEVVRDVMRKLPVREMSIDPTRLIPVALGGNDRYIMICEKL